MIQTCWKCEWCTNQGTIHKDGYQYFHYVCSLKNEIVLDELHEIDNMTGCENWKGEI